MAKGKGGGNRGGGSSRANDRGPAGNTASTTSPFTPQEVHTTAARSASRNAGLGAQVGAAGSTVSRNEAVKIAEQTGKTVAQVMAKALDRGATLGSSLVNNYNRGNLGPNDRNLTNFGGVPIGTGINGAATRAITSLQALQGLQMGKGQVYAGSTTTTTSRQNHWDPLGGSSYTPGTTTYNPIVLPRGMTAAGQGGAGGAGGNGNGGGNGNVKNDGSIESIKALYAQQMDDARAEMEKYAQMQAEAISTMQLDFGNQIGEIQSAADARVSELSDLMMFQQQQAQSTQNLLQQQAQAAERAYQEQARVASALGTAFVPGVEQSAASVSLGDQRTTQSEKQQNSLSDLAIVSGLGTNSNPLAGLQLA